MKQENDNFLVVNIHRRSHLPDTQYTQPSGTHNNIIYNDNARVFLSHPS